MLSLRINKNNNDLHDILQGISWESIWQNLRRPSLGLVLFLIGLNGMFFLPLIFPYAQGYYTKMGTYRYYLLSWISIHDNK